MKKTLIALGVLAALPSLAMSAEVSIYGKVDVGLSFINVDPGIDGVDSKSTFGMMSGQTAGSRVGMTGFEELGNGTKVGFFVQINLCRTRFGKKNRLSDAAEEHFKCTDKTDA